MNTNLKIGDTVKILSLKKTGVIASVVKGDSVKVAIGSFVLRCMLSDLQFQPSAEPKPKFRSRSQSVIKSKTSTVIDLHGLNSKDAKEALLKFVSDAVVAGHPQVSVIHGHGNGTLKRMVHATLSELEMVASFRHPVNNTAETKIYFDV